MRTIPPPAGTVISRLDSLAANPPFPYPLEHFGPELQAYLNMLGSSNRAEGRAVYTVVLWTGPSGMAQAEAIADQDPQPGAVLAFGRTPRPNGYYYTGLNTSLEC